MVLESDQAAWRGQADSTHGARPVESVGSRARTRACEGTTWDDGAQNVLGRVWVQTGLGRSRLELSRGAIQRAGAGIDGCVQPDMVMVGAGMGTVSTEVTRFGVYRGVLG